MISPCPPREMDRTIGPRTYNARHRPGECQVARGQYLSALMERIWIISIVLCSASFANVRRRTVVARQTGGDGIAGYAPERGFQNGETWCFFSVCSARAATQGLFNVPLQCA